MELMDKRHGRQSSEGSDESAREGSEFQWSDCLDVSGKMAETEAPGKEALNSSQSLLRRRTCSDWRNFTTV